MNSRGGAMSSNLPNYAEKSTNPTVAPNSYVQGDPAGRVLYCFFKRLFLQVVQALLLESGGVK